MKTIRVFLSGCVVYLSVAAIHACGGSASSSSTMGGAGGAGGAKTSASSAASGAGGSITNPVGDAQADSGSRLKAQWLVGEDGSKQFDGFYDSVRKEQCQFLNMSDGKKHCVPVLTSLSVSHVYLDAGCTVDAWYAYSPCYTDTVYGYQYDIASCSYSIGTLTQIPIPVDVYAKTVGGCDKAIISTGVLYFTMSPEIQPSAFVAASVTTDP